VTLRQPGATGVEATSLVITQQALVAVKDWTFMIGPGMAGLNALLLGTLMYRSGLVPRIIPTLGLIGRPLFWSAQIATMFGFNETATVWSGIGLLPIFIWELSLGLWMTFKGFRKDPRSWSRPLPKRGRDRLCGWCTVNRRCRGRAGAA
jgi:hypothetical protein